MTKDFLKDTVKYLPAQIALGIVGLISIPIITRIFLPQDYGHYKLVMATITVLTIMVSWLTMSIIRFYPTYERDKKLDIFYGSIIRLTFFSVFCIAIIFFIFLLLIKSIISIRLFSLMSIGIGVFIVMAIFNVSQHFLRAKRHVSWYSGFEIWRSTIGFSLGIGLIVLFKFGVAGLLLGIILSEIIILPFLWRKAIANTFIKCSNLNLSFAKEISKYSFPLVVGNLSAWILSLSDRYILEFFRGSKEVGIYSASYSISEKTILFLTVLFNLAAGPIVIHIWEKEGKEKSAKFVTKITRYYLIACVPAVIGLSALSKPLVDIMTGEQYFEGYKVILFVAPGILFYGLQQRFQTGLLLYKHTGYVTFSVVISGLFNLFLNILFVPKYGYIAAAITTLISYVTLVFLMILFSRRFFVWKFPFKSLVNVTCASSVMGIIVYRLEESFASSVFIKLILSICIGAAVYFIMLMILRELEKDEIQIFYLLKQKVKKNEIRYK